MMTLLRQSLPFALASWFALLALLSPARGHCAAPPGAPVVQVIELWEPEADPRAQALTNALREVIYEADDFSLNTRSTQLLPTALEAKCDTGPFGAELVESSERGMSPACLERIAKRLGTKAFFWGFLFKGERGRTMVKLHLWQPTGDRSAVLVYDEKNRRRVAERLYRHVVAPGKVGDLTLVAAAGTPQGELFLNGRRSGTFEGAETALTVPLGAVAVEVRAGTKVLARGAGTVGASGVTTVRLEPVAEPATTPAVPTSPKQDGLSLTERETPSALPWVFGGVGVVGLVGAGAFLALRQDAKGELGDACRGDKCPSPQDDLIARGNLYGTLSLVSLGVGVAGLGAAAYFFLDGQTSASTSSSSGRRFVGAVVPVTGGALAGLSGRF